MKKLIPVLLLTVALLLPGCGGTSDTTDAEPTGADSETTDAVTESDGQTEAPVPEPQYPDYYIDFADEQNVYACSNLYNVSTEYTGDGMRVRFIASGSDPDYCFDPYMTLPVPAGKFSIDDYPYFVMSLYTSKSDLKGDIRYRTDGLKNPDSYPTYRFPYGGTGERLIVLNLKKMSSVLFVAPSDVPVTGNYTHLRMDMFENDCSTNDEFVIHWFAFFKTKKEAEAFREMPRKAQEEEKLPDLSAFYRGEEFAKPDNAFKPKKLLYGFETGVYDFPLNKIANNGYGGVVTNVKFDRNYLKDDAQFETVANAFKYANGIGLHTWIYDEYQWPSGKAFGQVLDGHDEYEATGIELLKVEGSGDVGYALPSGYQRIVGADLVSGSVTHLETDERTVSAPHTGKYTLYVYALRKTHEGKTEDPADFSTLRDVDLLNPDAVARFIDLTYRKYKDKLGDAFDAVEAFFTDEPQLGNRDMKNYVVWTAGLPDKFKEMHGYDIIPELYSLYAGNTAHDRLVRVNFYQTVSELFRVSYFEQIAKWCEENGKAASGHLLFEENIQRQIETYGGDFMQMVGAMTIPGADVLQVEPDRLMSKGTDIGSFMGLKYVSSAAKNAGKNKVHLEFTPVAVDGAPFFSDQRKYSVAGATLTSLFGANTYTVICHDDAMSAPDLQFFTTYEGRINTLLGYGTTATDIAVFYPVDTVRAAYTATGGHFDYNGADEAAAVNRLMQDTCYDIIKAGLDFTVLDVQSVASADVSGGKMKVGLGEYSVIVMPSVRVISLEAMKKIVSFEQGGGTVLWLQSLPETCDDGRDAEEFAALMKSYGGRKYTNNVVEKLAGLSPAPMELSVKNGVYAAEYVRPDDGKRILYLANSTKTSKTVSVRQDGKYYIYDPYDCTVTEASGRSDVKIPAYRALLIVR